VNNVILVSKVFRKTSGQLLRQSTTRKPR
jgi:hypothetical protein